MKQHRGNHWSTSKRKLQQTFIPSYASAESLVLFKLRNFKFGSMHRDRSPSSVTGVSLRFKLCNVLTCSDSN